MSEQAEQTAGISKGSGALESALNRIWEKARRASEVIVRLRDDNRALQKRVAELEAELANVKEGFGAKSEEINKLSKEFSLLESSNNDAFSREEKEELKNKIQELIHKINSHL